MTTSENELIARAGRFETAALAEIYDVYSPGVYRYAARLLGEAGLAEDCVADTFVRYLQAVRGGGGPREHLQAYLYRIAHNWITDHYRRQPPPPLELTEEHSNGDGDPLQAALASDARRQVRSALLQLTPEQRQVIVLKYLEGWENERVALSLDKPVGTVKALQHRALAALRRLLLPQTPARKEEQKEEMYDSSR